VPLLDVQQISVRFGGLQALDTVDLQVDAGSVTGLIGPNGAGKTTLFNVICGLQEPTRGRILLDDEDVTGVKPYKRARLGVARTFQRLEVFGSLSARDNILVAAEIHRGWNRNATEPTAVVEDVLDKVGLRAVANDRVDSLPTGLARLVELGRALATQPRLLLLDEPGSGLDEDESDDLSHLLKDLSGQGLGVLIVEHDVELVMRTADRIFVLDFGRILASGTPKEIQTNALVQAAYLGQMATAEGA
jgi:branched-chain amino acid transport system ATP-binding protein